MTLLKIRLSIYNIALCFYGEARNWQVGAETIKNFHNLSKDKFNVHVYCHLWDNITRRSKNIRSLIKRNINLDEKCVVSYNLQHEELLDKYKPVNYKIENKQVLDPYIDKFNPNDQYMSCEEYKLAIKYSNTPWFSQFYSTAQSYYIINNKQEYDLIIILRTDCLFDDKSVIDKTLEFYCKYITRRQCLLVERMSLVPSRKEPWLYSGYMLGNCVVFNNLFEQFPKIPVGMGQYPGANRRGNSHAEMANYILNYTNVHRVWPLLIRSHPRFIGKYKQFNLETLSIN